MSAEGEQQQQHQQQEKEEEEQQQQIEDTELQKLFHELESLRAQLHKTPSPTTRWKVRKIEMAIREKGAFPPHEKPSYVPNVSLKVKEVAVSETGVSPRMVKENVGVEMADVGGGGKGVGIRALVARFMSFQAAAASPMKTPPRSGLSRQESLTSPPREEEKPKQPLEKPPVGRKVMDGLYFGEDWVGLEEVGGKFVQTGAPMVELVEEEDCTWSFTERKFLPRGNKSVCFPKPLLTTSEKTELQGIKSGKRSAVFRHEAGTYYRLIGCRSEKSAQDKGDENEEGRKYYIENTPDEKKGSTSQDICFRELYMTSLIQKELKTSGKGIRCANEPVGFFCYDDEESGRKEFCSVFQTIGDKRVGRDLLPGLERLYQLMIPGTYDPDDLMDLFDLDRMEGCEVSPTWLACATCGQKPLDLVSCHIPEMPPEAPYCLPIKQVPLWNKCREKIRDYIVSLGKKPPRGWPRCLLAFMFWQIGWDCGVTLRSLHQSGKITWGRFWHDENENEEKVPHFNGHPNSFVVLPPELVEDHLMAPLNFDLAYTEASYESKEKGDAEENFDVELNFLRLVLAGADIRTSAIIPETSSEFRIQMVSIGMRDTLLAGFDCAFAGEKNAHPFVPELKGVIVAMTQVALMLGDLNDKLDPLV